jgi:hypothetical protein
MKPHFMKAYGGVEVQIHAFVTLDVNGDEWSPSSLGCCTAGDRSPRRKGGWVGLEVGLDSVEKRI